VLEGVNTEKLIMIIRNLYDFAILTSFDEVSIAKKIYN
jgi:hypothetical protein